MMTNTRVENTAVPAHDGRRSPTALALFVYKLLPPLPLQRIERGPTPAWRRTPFGLDDAAIFEPLQGRMQ